MAFEKALTPPPVAAVDTAILGLQRTAALDEAERLTPLGRHLAALPVDIGVGRLLLYGCLFRCAYPILLIAAALSDRSPFLQPMAKRDEAKAVQGAAFNLHQSDHLATLEAHRQWEKIVAKQGKGAARAFCDRHFLSERTLLGMTDAANQFWDQLAALGLLPNLRGLSPADKDAARAAANKHADNVAVLQAVLCAGLFPNVVKATSSSKGGLQLAQGKQSLSIHPSSFNRTCTRFDSGWLAYHEKVATGKIYIHDVTPVTALDLFLFGAEPQVLHAQHRVIIDGWIELRISPRTAVLFKALRRHALELMADKIEKPDAAASSASSAAASASSASGGRQLQPGERGWPPPLETREAAQEAVLASLVWMIGKGMELQVDELNAAAAAAKKAKADAMARR